ncbi:MAG: Wzz/FepE/Etk N-terminal domain-containing protein [Gallionellaceae bacterium]
MDKQDNNIQPAKQGVPVMLIAQPIETDDINLLEMWGALARRKSLIAIIAAVATGIGLLYALLATPVYQTTTILAPPSAMDIAELQPFGAPPIEPDAIFKRFIKHLDSKSIRRDYFLHHGVVDTLAPDAKTDQELRVAANSFYNSLSYRDGTLTLTGTDPKLITDWLNDFVHLANQRTLEDEVAYYNSLLQHKITSVKHDIDGKLKMAKQVRKDRIAIIEEALSIAENLGTSKGMDGKASGFSQNPPLYMLGAKALKAQREVLQQRKDDTPFIPGLRELQSQMLLFAGNAITPDNIHVMHIEEVALPPKYRFKPKRKLIVLASLLAGIVLGVLAVFVIEASTRSSERKIID